MDFKISTLIVDVMIDVIEDGEVFVLDVVNPEHFAVQYVKDQAWLRGLKKTLRDLAASSSTDRSSTVSIGKSKRVSIGT